jgi:8-oxo-dGTP pyrophosphatase MutT (NUDIX family)
MKIKKKKLKISKYISLTEKKIYLRKIGEIYHSISQRDYVSILAITKNKKFLLVKQYRPAIEKKTLELPGGLVDKNEKHLVSAKRELVEETGHIAKKIIYLGSYYPDVGRLENKFHCYFSKNVVPIKNFVSEKNIKVIQVSLNELKFLIKKKKISHFLHVGLIGLAKLKNLIKFKI